MGPSCCEEAILILPVLGFPMLSHLPKPSCTCYSAHSGSETPCWSLLSPLVCVSSSLSSGWCLCPVADFPLSCHRADAYTAWFHLMPSGASCSGREEKWRNKTGKRRGKSRTDIRLFLKEMFLVVLSCRSSVLTFNMCQFYVECNLRIFCALFC